MFPCGFTGFRCLDPSSSCYGTSSTFTSISSSTNPFDDDAAGVISGGYHDDDVTSNSPGYDSADVADDDGIEYGDRDFSSSADSTAVGVQDIMGGSSESSFSDIEMAGVFVLSAAAFIVFGCAVLAACWCCRRGGKDSAAAGAAGVAAGAGAPRTRRGWFRSRQKSPESGQQGPPSPRTQEAAEVGVVGAQEGKHADEAELGAAFYGTGNAGDSRSGSTEGRGDVGAAAGDDTGDRSEGARAEERDTSTPVVAGAGNGGDVAGDEKEEEQDVEGGEVPEGGVVGEEAKGGSVEDEAGRKKTDEAGAVKRGEEEQQIEQDSSAAEDAAGVEETTMTADKPEADGPAADEKSVGSHPPGQH